MSSVSDYNAYTHAAQRTQDAYEAERSQSRANHEHEIDDLKEDQQKELDDARDEYNSRLQQVRDDAADDVRKLKQEMYDQRGKKYANDSRDLSDERNRLDDYRQQIEDEAQKRVDRADHSAHEQSLRSARTTDEKIEEALAAQKRSHQDEINELRDEMEIYKDHQYDVDHEKAQARQDQISDYEGDRLKERDQITSAYEKRIRRMKEKEADREHFYTRQLNDATFDANERSKRQIRTQKDEFTRIDLDRRADAKRLEQHYEDAIKNERLRNRKSEGTLIRNNDEDLNRALAQKDRNYRDYLKENSRVHAKELQERDREIAQLKTTDDPMKVSPFVAQKIRNEAEQRNAANLRKAQEVQNKNFDSLKKREADGRRELEDQYAHKYSDWNRDQQHRRDLEKREFLTGYADLKTSSQRQRDQLKERHSDEIQRLATKHSEQMNLQARRFRDDLDVQRDAQNQEKDHLREDLEIQQRGRDREWFTRMNQMRRDYEHKLMDEHDQNDRMRDELKFTFDKKLQDQERLSKKALDERVRAYEHQIAQQAVAFKERERFLTEHYEEELDSMRRTNARLIQKKS